MGDVGYVDAHLPTAVVEAADGQGVIEVLGVDGVDGEGDHVAHVDAAGHLVGRDAGVYPLGLAGHLGRVAVGQAEFGEDGVHLGLVVAGVAQHVDYLAYGVLGLGGPAGDAGHGFLSLAGAV